MCDPSWVLDLREVAPIPLPRCTSPMPPISSPSDEKLQPPAEAPPQAQSDRNSPTPSQAASAPTERIATRPMRPVNQTSRRSTQLLSSAAPLPPCESTPAHVNRLKQWRPRPREDPTLATRPRSVLPPRPTRGPKHSIFVRESHLVPPLERIIGPDMRICVPRNAPSTPPRCASPPPLYVGRYVPLRGPAPMWSEDEDVPDYPQEVLHHPWPLRQHQQHHQNRPCLQPRRQRSRHPPNQGARAWAIKQEKRMLRRSQRRASKWQRQRNNRISNPQ